MKPAYRPPPLIYRGQRRRVPQGACPVCEREISVSPSGRRRAHKDAQGLLCTGSGVQLRERTLAAYDLDAALAAVEAMGPPIVRLDQATATTVKAINPLACPECGRAIRENKDGTLRAHRPEPDTFVGPYCPGGRAKGRV